MTSIKHTLPVLVFVLICIAGINADLHAQDYQGKDVAPGIIHYSITLHEGPFNIQVLEIDVTDPVTQIKTVLANDVLGDGFERTSAISKRKSGSGHIVVGAINGDFYGITEPTNPYGFLANSMITDYEYVFGRSLTRSSFAMRDENRPLVDIINFSGNVYASSGEQTEITRFNAERQTNNLIMYNRFFGSSTRTNEYGTEVRLEPLSGFAINEVIQFLVTEKSSGVGNMTFQENEYVLSGHGSAQTFLDTHIAVEDTIGVRLGTNPDKGNLSALMGGGPRLVTNGTRPASFVGVEGMSDAFVNTQHPRTAVGFNEDSTRVYFVTVDGRQSGFSVGMSLGELADFLISFGIAHAVNLDGGGSTTMVVHDQVVNSPSDPGGERSVANILIAVREVEIPQPGIPTLVLPSDGAEDQHDMIDLVWNSVEYAATYNIQVSADSMFSENLIVNEYVIIDTVYTLSGLEGQQQYYWRVLASNAAGSGGYSPVYGFFTGFPSVPVQDYPPHGTVNVSVTPTLAWHPAIAAQEYRVQLATGRTIVPENIVLDTLGIADTLVTLPDLTPERIFYWRVNASNEFGTSAWSDSWGFRTEPLTGIEAEPDMPGMYNIRQNYPNPFNPVTTIRFEIPRNDHVRIDIYNLVGQHIDTLVDGYKGIGTYSIAWDAADYTSGVYYCVLTTKYGVSKSIPMILLR
jgi:hypothetical protein